MRNKDVLFIRHGTVVIGLIKIGANVNRRTRVTVPAYQAHSASVEGVKTVGAANFFGTFAVKAANGSMLVAKAA